MDHIQTRCFQWSLFDINNIFRRFKQFDELDSEVGHVLAPEYTLPSKTLGHKVLQNTICSTIPNQRQFDDEFVNKRREELDLYIRGCCERIEQLQREKERRHWYRFIKPAQLGDLRCDGFTFDIFALPDQ